MMTLVADSAFGLKRLWLGRQRVRRTRLYCVGTAKSGTHSVSSMFSGNVAAAHEPQACALIEKYFDWHEGRIGEEKFQKWLRERERESALEVDSSWFNILILDFLAREFPDARFVLTIRDCYSWLNSEFKRVLHTPSQEPARIKMRRFLYECAGAVHLPEEQVLKGCGLHTLDGYLARWTTHNEKVLTTISEERLLIVRTREIRQRAFEIADFAGLPRHSVRLKHTHDYRNPVQRNIICELDRDFLERKVEEHCRPLMMRFFPGIKTFDDATI
jgi:hypothetical protein